MSGILKIISVAERQAQICKRLNQAPFKPKCMQIFKEITNPAAKIKASAYQFPENINLALSDAEFPKALKAFKDELRQTGLGDIVDNFDHFASPETLLAQREYFQILKHNKLNFSAYDSLSSTIYTSPKNFKFRKEALELLSEETMLSKFSIGNIISNTNKAEQVEIIKSCLKNQDVPQNLICEFVEKAETMPIKEVLNEIKNNPIVMTNKAIREAEISLIPKGIKPQKLNPLNIDKDALALVHMTSYEPEFGEILSTRDKLMRLQGVGGPRNSVHFTLNHPVQSHRLASWDSKKIVIIMPYTATQKANGAGKFIEGLPNDLWTNGSVKIPEGSVMVKYNPNLKPGEINSYLHNELSGVTVIEASVYPHDITPTVLKKMGYSYLPTEQATCTGAFITGESHGNTAEDICRAYKAWKDFASTQGIKPMLHSCTPACLADDLIDGLNIFRKNNNWGKNEEYVKSVIKKTIDEVRAGEKQGFFSGYDIDKLEDILLHSGTPNETFERLAREMNIGPTYSFEEFLKKPHYSETRLMDALLTQVKSNPKAQKFFNSPYIDINHIRKGLAFDF